MQNKVSRRAMLATGASALAAAPALGWTATPSGRRPPNVIFIMADDLGYADLSCYGQRAFATPVLDRLAADGLKMTDGYANAPVCSPTRVALLTGRYQQRLPVGLPEPITTADVSVPADHPTIASLFKQLGYRTALVGKWHLGRHPAHSPMKSGYDQYFGFQGGASDYFTHSGLNKRGGGAGLWEDDRPVDRPGYLTDSLTDYAVNFVRANASNPYFLSLHFSAPHWPWEGPGDEAVANALTNVRHNDGGGLAKYGELVRNMDAAIGKVLAALRASGRERDTIVIFTSDNGGERFSDNFPFSGRKSELLEGGVRVPVIVRWPGQIRRGSTSNQVIASMDWLPTLLAAAGGAPAPSHAPDGENLLAVLTAREQPRPRKLFWRVKSSGQASVRDGNWKYLRIENKEFLFDVAIDPQERADLKDRQPGVFSRLKSDWEAWNRTMLPYPADSYSETPKSLGYADRY